MCISGARGLEKDAARRRQWVCQSEQQTHAIVSLLCDYIFHVESCRLPKKLGLVVAYQQNCPRSHQYRLLGIKELIEIIVRKLMIRPRKPRKITEQLLRKV